MLNEIWLGDAAKALELTTKWPRTQRADLWRLLGFEMSTTMAQFSTASGGEATPYEYEVVDEDEEDDIPAPATRAPRKRTEPTTQKPDDTDPPLLQPIAREAPFFAGSTDATPLPRATASDDDESMLPHLSLLSPRSARAVLQAASSRAYPDGELDVEALVATIAAARPVRALPRRSVRAMRFGVELLVDVGASMSPFKRDEVDVVTRARRIAGNERTSVVYFADAPTRGAGEGPSWTWSMYLPSSTGQRLFVLSDFGVGGPLLSRRRSTISEWRKFAEIARAHDCDVVGLVPHPRTSWPDELRRLFPLMSWDRSTTSSAAFTAVVG